MKIQNIENITFGKRNKMKTKIENALKRDNDFILRQYYEDIKDIKPLSRTEQRMFAKQVNEKAEGAARARESLILAALPLIVYHANYYKGLGMEFADLIQEGNYAISVLLDKNTYTGSINLNGYVFLNVISKIVRAIENKGCLIRIPSNVISNNKVIKKVEKQLELELKRPVTNKEIAEFFNISKKKVERFRNIAIAIEPLSDKLVDKISIEHYISAGEKETDAQKNLDLEQLRKDLKVHLEKLKPIKREIIIKRFGLFGVKSQSSMEIAKEKNLTKARVNMIIQESLNTLKRGNRSAVTSGKPDLTIYL